MCEDVGPEEVVVLLLFCNSFVYLIFTAMVP